MYYLYSHHFPTFSVVCSVGQFAKTRDGPCKLCPIGRYQDETGQTECKICPAQRTTDQQGATSVSECVWLCTKGSYYDFDTNECELCPMGMYMDEYAATRCCKPCPAGTTTAAEGTQYKGACSGESEWGDDLADTKKAIL